MTPNKTPPPGLQAKPVKGPRNSILARLRNYFFAGVLVTAPAGVTLYLVYLFVTFVDERVISLIPGQYNPETYLPFSIPGLGVLLAVVTLITIGAIAAGFLGRFFVRIYEGILQRTPVIRGIFNSIKQVMETVFSSQSDAFRDVVLLEFFQDDLWVMGFVTGRTRGDIQRKTENEMINVFIPTTPNPTSGWLVFVPQEKLTYLDMTVEGAFKMLISSGIVVPGEEAAKLKKKDPPK